MTEKGLEGYLSNETKECIDQIVNKMDKLLNSILDYKNNDTVYFWKTFDSDSLVAKQKYRSAKKYTDFLFPTYELAVEYRDVFYYEMFSVLEMVTKDIAPRLVQERIGKFASIENMHMDNWEEFKVKIEHSPKGWSLKQMLE